MEYLVRVCDAEDPLEIFLHLSLEKLVGVRGKIGWHLEGVLVENGLGYLLLLLVSPLNDLTGGLLLAFQEIILCFQEWIEGVEADKWILFHLVVLILLILCLALFVFAELVKVE